MQSGRAATCPQDEAILDPTATPPAAALPAGAATAPKDGPPRLGALLRHRGAWLGGVLLVALASGIGLHYACGTAKIAYVTATVERGDVESTVVAAGVLQPVKYVDVGAQTSGKLTTLKVQRGDRVTANQLLAEIDPALANAALTAAGATLENMTSQRRLKSAQLLLARLQAGRNDQLYADRLISASDRDVTRAGYDAARADVASLTAQMKQASAAVDTARANLGYTQISAPMAGEVVSISLLEGQTLNANQQAPNILRIADISTITVWAQVSEADIVRVKPGQEVYFTILGDTRRWTGRVRQLLPTPELVNNVVFYDVLFDVPNPDGELNIQMTAQVFIVLARARGVLRIPAAAVGNAGEGTSATVQVLGTDGRAEPRSIQVGIKSELQAEVLQGLKEKERVVIGSVATKGSGTKSALSARKGP